MNMTDTKAAASCPLCCNEFSRADVLYPIHCPTIQCHFQYCMKCIESLISSSNDGYAEASDGSYQVKISIRCPMCRAPYRTPNQSHHLPGGQCSPTGASNSIVNAILQLRQAASIQIPSAKSCNRTNDSDLSASELAQRNQFIMNTATSTTTIIKELKDAITTVQQYYDSIDHKDCGTVPALPWEDWEQYIQMLQRQEQEQQKLQLSNMSLSSNQKGTRLDEGTNVSAASQPVMTISRDPTLFMGLDELLTYDEQEFITHMFISGDAELIAQAANLLHSIMCTMMMEQQQQQPHPSKNNNNGTSTAKASTSIKKQKTMAQLDHEQKIRKKFPIPNHMPRVVTIPPYNPLNCGKNPPIKFVPPPKPPPPPKAVKVSTPTAAAAQPTESLPPQRQPPIAVKHNNELMLASVNGVAGRVGLRRGDIITHVNQERVSTFSEYTIAVQYALEQQQQPSPPDPPLSPNATAASMSITVNANEETAQQLLKRAQQMQQQNVRFHC